MKLGFLIMFLTFSILGFSQDKQDYEKLDFEKVKSDLHSIKTEMDSSMYYVKATYRILKDEVKMFGLKKTLQINFSILKPYLICIGFLSFWLIKRAKKANC